MNSLKCGACSRHVEFRARKVPGINEAPILYGNPPVLGPMKECARLSLSTLRFFKGASPRGHAGGRAVHRGANRGAVRRHALGQDPPLVDGGPRAPLRGPLGGLERDPGGVSVPRRQGNRARSTQGDKQMAAHEQPATDGRHVCVLAVPRPSLSKFCIFSFIFCSHCSVCSP